MLLLAGGANAQTAKSDAVYTGKLDATPVSVVKKAKAPMMKGGENLSISFLASMVLKTRHRCMASRHGILFRR